MIAIDTETTGLDLYHGAKPYFATTCDEEGKQTWWEFDVDPLTREPSVDCDLSSELGEFIDDQVLVLQNPTFDVRALETVGCRGWDWSNTFDTLLAGHLLASNQAHDLTTMVLIYLGVNVKPFDEALKKACMEARRMAKTEFPEWRTAKAGLPEMPSAKQSVWKFDGWLPRAIAKEKGYKADHPWWTVLRDYANSDSATTIALFKVQQKLLKERRLWGIYKVRMKIPEIVHEMESYGVTLNGERLEEIQSEYIEESQRAGRVCTSIAKSYGCELTLPKSGNNNSLLATVGTILDDCGPDTTLPKSKKTGNPSLNKAALEGLMATLPTNKKPYTFFKTLRGKRKRDTAITYLEAYKRYWIPNVSQASWYRLHPSLNPTGTNTLRWSSSNPNEQNISKQEGFNLRYCFGPAPGREWWSADAKNIELRLPAYEAGETEMIELFERPDDPPYFGSYHLLIFDTLHPRRFAKYGADCKKEFASTWYQWTKNGNFAVQYGAVESSGTADRAYHVPGAQRRIQGRFSRIKQLNDKMIELANQQGYVETIPDKTVDPDRGYPLYCTQNTWGGISPTIPFNYHVQGSAMWWMMKGMIRCAEYLREYNSNRNPENHIHMVMQVHDELVFDFPKSKVDPTTVEDRKTDKFNYLRTNIPVIKKLCQLMAKGGDDFGMPTPVSREYHPETWSSGLSV